jgi:hypothetical protein
MWMRKYIAPGVFCLACFSFSCIDRETSVGTGKVLPDKILSVSGNNQSGVVGSEAFADLTVRVLDPGNQPIAKVKVEFLVQYGSAFVSDTIATTNFDGIAKTKVTYGLKADTIGIHAILLGVKGSPVLFSLQSYASNVSLLKAISDTVIVGTVASTRLAAVRASDIYNNPLKNSIIKFEAKSGKGSVADVNVVTYSDGSASTLWTLDTLVGTNTLEVSIVGNSMKPLVFTATTLPGSAANLIALAGDKQFGFVEAELPVPLEVAALDRYGNYLTSPSVQFTNPRRRGGPTFKNRFDNTDLIPARTDVTIVLGSNTGTNLVVASMPPASPAQFGFNAYLPVLMLNPTSSAGVVNVQWAMDMNPNFGSYQIFRSTTAGVTTSSTLLSTITDEAVTSYADSAAIAGAKYFYSLYMSFTNGESFFSNEVDITP